MTRKLSYSRDAFIARVRMSQRTALFVVVEGKEFDSPFYEGVCGGSSKVREAGHQVWLIEQITRDQQGNTSGGKQSVLAFYDYCRRNKVLRLANSGGFRSIVFCIDRDNDDIAASLRRSNHVIYTDTYDAEAHAFLHGEPLRAVAAAASLDRESTEAFLAAIGDWR